MNPDIAVPIVGVLLFVVFFSVLTVFFRRRVNLAQRVRLDAPEQRSRSLSDYVDSVFSVFKPLGEVIPRSPQEMSRQERRLVQAGIRRKDAVVLFHGSQFALAIILLLAGLALLPPSRYTVAVALGSIVFGAALPDIWLSRTIDARKERIQDAVPDALDLAVVCVEAGLALDQSLMRISSEIQDAYPDLSEEFRLQNIEVNMGRNRSEAFRNLAARTGVDDLKSLVAILIQSDRFGTSVGQALRVFADALRVKRQQRARERAAKLPIKMIPIMVFFIFPSIFVVVVGPAVIQILQGLLPLFTGQ